MHRLALLVLASLLMPAVVTVPATEALPAAGAEPLGCGALAPFRESCEDCCDTYRGGTPEVELNALGYVGRLDLRLRGDDGSWYWSCWFLGAEAVARCESWVTGEGLERNERVRLYCYARETVGPGLPAPVGPAGAWGCLAEL